MPRGTSLVELLAVMAIGSVLAGVSVVLLAVIVRSASEQQRQLEQDRRLARLAAQFRQDVRAAERIVSPIANGLFGLEDSDKNLVYRRQGNSIERETLRAGKSVAREAFRLPSDSTATIDREEDAGATFVRLRVEPESATAPASGPRARTLCVVARLGRDRRYLAKAEPAKEGQRP